MDVVGPLQLALDITKKLKALNERIKDVDLKMLIADLQDEIAEAKLESVSLKEKLVALSNENAELSRQLDAKSSEEPEMMGGGYKFGDKGPYCIPCYEKSGKKLVLPRATGINVHFGPWYCPVCKTHS